MADRKSKFERDCEAVSEKLGISVYFIGRRGDLRDDQFEDDGNLHIRHRGISVCFDVGNGQSLDGAKQNERTRAVLTALGMDSKIGPRVLVDETEDDDDYCEHCGRGG